MNRVNPESNIVVEADWICHFRKAARENRQARFHSSTGDEDLRHAGEGIFVNLGDP